MLLAAQIQTAQADETVFELSPFVVAVEATRGYLATNSITATGFNMENFRIPLNISVATDAFLRDLGVQDLSEATFFLSGVTVGDQDAGSRQGANFRVRGFETSWANRNGIRRYSIVGTDNVERLEILKGPNAVFYGQAAPGGIVNYVTKRPQFTPLQVVTAEINTNGRMKGTLESQGPIGPESFPVAYRLMAAYEDDNGWRDFEYRKRFFGYGGLRLRPVRGLEIFLEYERTEDERNFGSNVPMGNRQYMAEYANPPQELIDHVLSIDPRATPDNVLNRLRLRWLDIAGWQSDHRAVYGVMPPRNVDFMPEATPYGREWNIRGPGGFVDGWIETYNIEMIYQLSSALSFRGLVLWDDRQTDNLESIRYHVRGDGSFNPAPVTSFGLRNLTRQIVFETVARFELFRVHNQMVFGFNQYNDRWNPMDFTYRIGSEMPQWFFTGWRPFEDPYFDLRDTVADFTPVARSGQINQQRSYYVNWSGEWLGGRLNTLAGLRLEEMEQEFVSGTGELLNRAPEYRELTPMIGAAYEFMDGLSVFASYSQSARPSVGPLITGPGATPEEIGAPRPPAIGEGYDLGLKASINDNMFAGTLSLFRVISKDEVMVRDVDRTDNDPRNLDGNPNTNVVWSRPAGSRTSEGLEFELIYTASTNYQAVFSYTWLATAEVTDDPTNPALNGRRLGHSPEHTIGIWNKFDFTEGALDGFSVGLGLRFMSRFNAQGPTSPNQYDLPSFYVVDMMLRYAFKVGRSDVTATLNIRNLLDRRYYERPPAQPGEPIRANLSLSLSF